MVYTFISTTYLTEARASPSFSFLFPLWFSGLLLSLGCCVCSLWLLIGQMVIVGHHRGDVLGFRLRLSVPLSRMALSCASYRSEVHQLCNLHITGPCTDRPCSMGRGALLKIPIFVKNYALKWGKKDRNCNLMPLFRVQRVFLIFHFIDICTNIGFSSLPFLSIYFVKNIRFPHRKPLQPSLLSVSTENSFLKLWFLQDFRKLQQAQMLFLWKTTEMISCPAVQKIITAAADVFEGRGFLIQR